VLHLGECLASLVLPAGIYENITHLLPTWLWVFFLAQTDVWVSFGSLFKEEFSEFPWHLPGDTCTTADRGVQLV
jgi:hypothetical protein